MISIFLIVLVTTLELYWCERNIIWKNPRRCHLQFNPPSYSPQLLPVHMFGHWTCLDTVKLYKMIMILLNYVFWQYFCVSVGPPPIKTFAITVFIWT